MALTTLDVIMLLPPELERMANGWSDRLAAEMAAAGHPSAVRLGRRRPGAGPAEGISRAHVSIAMTALDEDEVPQLVGAVRRVAAGRGPIMARGGWYANNGQGAPEIFFEPAPAWSVLQEAVLAVIEPLRRGRLRAEDPNGESVADIIEQDGDRERVGLLRRYGYDEIGDRFHPHVTLAWPENRSTTVGTGALPSPSVFSGTLTRLAVYGMSSYGTCTRPYAEFVLGD